jgi:hypothetical protein
MADQQHATPPIVVGDVVLPGVSDVGVGQLAVRLDRDAPETRDERGERDLAIHRREHATRGAEPGRLLPDDEDLLAGCRRQVAVARLVAGDRGIDVEAIELRTARGAPALDPRLAVRLDAGCVHIPIADVVGIAAAEPVRRIGVDGAPVARIGIGRCMLRGRDRRSSDRDPEQ